VIGLYWVLPCLFAGGGDLCEPGLSVGLPRSCAIGQVSSISSDAHKFIGWQHHLQRLGYYALRLHEPAHPGVARAEATGLALLCNVSSI
jgi:hypothetical protein